MAVALERLGGGAAALRVERGSGGRVDAAVKRLLDIAVAGTLLLVALPVVAVVAAAIKLESPGPVFFRARRVGVGGSELRMLKFRKMADDAGGPALTVSGDERFTLVGKLLAATKLDELPQLWNVLVGDMSLVGPRPEDPGFVWLQRDAYKTILSVKPGVTGLCQLAFAREGHVVREKCEAGTGRDPTEYYIEELLPQKARIDELYARRRSLTMDLRILVWTAIAVVLRREVAVNRASGALTLRRRAGGELGEAPGTRTPAGLRAGLPRGEELDAA